MKITYNPTTAAALTTAPNNNDITFDLKGLNIFTRGIKFKGTDTTYSVFKKHTSSGSGGYNGLVPVPSYTATNVRFLREDGTWSIPAAAAFIYTQLTNQDLDDYLDEGRWYYAGGGNTTTNKPSGVDAYELYVGRNASGYRYQKLITSSGLIWFRYHDSSAWKTWVRWYTDMNTDQKVLQSATTTSNYRPLALGYTNTSTTADLGASVTQQVYVTTTIYAQPSTGSLWANKLYSGGKPVLTEHQSLANYVTLNTAQTVSGVKTFSTQQKFTVATGTSPFTVTSTTVVTNLNSDLLDGRHLGNATGRIPYIVSFPAYSSFGSSTSTLDYEKNILKWIWTNQNHGGDTLLIGVGKPNSIGNLQIQLYGTSGVNSSTGYPKYSSAIYYPLDDRPICFGTNNYNFYSYSLAFSDDIKDPANYYWANIKVSASSSTATQPTFNTCYTSNWFRSYGGTGWFNQSYSGGIYMNENYWVKTYGGTMMYIAPDAHAWGIGGHNIAMKLYHSSHIGINFATSAYTWGIYANSNGNMYIGRRSGNVNDDSGTYYHTLTASYISSPGFYHSAIGSNSYVLLAGGSYKGLGDFAKGNAGSATKGVYVTGGTVTAMTYSLNANLNSGTAGKLAYYSSATTVASYGSTVGASNRGIYLNAGTPTAMTYYLNATVNAGTSSKLAYYSGANSIDDYTSTVGSSTTPMYLSGGVPTVCSGVVIKYWAIYTINSINSTVTFTKDAGNYSFLTFIARVRDNDNGAYCVYCTYPSGYSWSNTIIWGSGSRTSGTTYPNIDGTLYVSTSSGGSNCFYVRTSDDASTNNGQFRLFMIWF